MAGAKPKTHTAYGGLTAARLAIARAALWNSRSVVGLVLSQRKPFALPEQSALPTVLIV